MRTLRVLVLLAMPFFLAACPQSGGGGDSALPDDPTGFTFTPISPSSPSGSSGSSATYDDEAGDTLFAANPSPPAPVSVVDPDSPWSILGELSGRYRLTVTRVSHDCGFGPDVPLSQHWRSQETDWVPYEQFEIDVTHRGDVIAFELGEGVVLARFDERSRRLVDVVRIGAEGKTGYDEGFAVDEDGMGFRGESAWRFEGDHYDVEGERCGGRTRWVAVRGLEPMQATSRDLQVVLRWPSGSRADLDLVVRAPNAAQAAGPIASARGCFAIHSAGVASGEDTSIAGLYADFVADLDETRLPWHEEIVRCSWAAYGDYQFEIFNWSRDEVVDWEIEVFHGRGVNTGGPGERSFGAIQGRSRPLSGESTFFRLLSAARPPSGSSSGGTAGFEATLELFPAPVPIPHAKRARGFLSGSDLEENKAAFEGLAYPAFREALEGAAASDDPDRTPSLVTPDPGTFEIRLTIQSIQAR